MHVFSATRRAVIALWALVAAGAGAATLLTLSPGAGWLDQSEFVAGAHTLGVVHPPGHPLYILLAKGMALVVPFGGIGFRVNLLSALFGVGSAVLVAELVRRIANHVRGDSALSTLGCALGAGWLFAATPACWLQSVRAEVYTLNLVLVLAGLLLAVRWWERGGRWPVLAFSACMGLAFCNHHYLVFFFVPAPFVLLLLRPDGRALLRSRTVLMAVGFVLLGLLAYAYLPLRAATDPVINWGDPTTPGRLFDTLAARTFQASVTTEAQAVSLSANLAVISAMLLTQLGPVGLLAGLGGLGVLVWRERPLGLLLFLAFVLNLLTKGLMRIDPQNPDAYGYLLLAVALLSVGAGLLPPLVADGPGRVRAAGVWVGAAAVLLGAAVAASAGYAKADLSQDETASALVDASLDRVQPDAVIFANYYSLFFNHWYAQLVMERRPDVAVVHASFDSRRYDGEPYVAQLRRRFEFLHPALDEFQRTRGFPIVALEELARIRPVYLEPMLERVAAPERLEAVGLVRRLGEAPVTDSEAARADRAFWRPLLERLYLGGPPGPMATKVLFWFHWLHVIEALRQGHGRTAVAILERIRAIDPAAELPDLEKLGLGLALFSERMARAGAATPFAELQLEVRRAFVREIDYLRILHGGGGR